MLIKGIIIYIILLAIFSLFFYALFNVSKDFDGKEGKSE